MARPGRGGRLCAERSQPELTGRLFSSPGFLGENQRPPRRCQQLRHTRWKGKDPARLLEKRFSASIYRESFWSPSASVGSHPRRAARGWDGARVCISREPSPGTKTIFPGPFPGRFDLIYSRSCCVVFFVVAAVVRAWMFAAPCGCTLLMTWQKAATGLAGFWPWCEILGYVARHRTCRTAVS